MGKVHQLLIGSEGVPKLRVFVVMFIFFVSWIILVESSYLGFVYVILRVIFYLCSIRRKIRNLREIDMFCFLLSVLEKMIPLQNFYELCDVNLSVTILNLVITLGLGTN